MRRELIVEALYNADADDLFKSALHFKELETAMAGLATYDGLPDREVVAGDLFVVDVTFWGFLKISGYRIAVESIDHGERILQSRENGNSIRQWDHQLSVTPHGERSLWRDHIIIDAGWQTPFMVRFGAFMYRRRHYLRQAISITHKIM